MAPTDLHQGEYGSFQAPASRAVAVVPSDSNDLTIVPRALYVGAAGDVKVITAGGDTVIFAAVPAGSILPVAVTRVLATGTAASSIVALW